MSFPHILVLDIKFSNSGKSKLLLYHWHLIFIIRKQSWLTEGWEF